MSSQRFPTDEPSQRISKIYILVEMEDMETKMGFDITMNLPNGDFMSIETDSETVIRNGIPVEQKFISTFEIATTEPFLQFTPEYFNLKKPKEIGK